MFVRRRRWLLVDVIIRGGREECFDEEM